MNKLTHLNVKIIDEINKKNHINTQIYWLLVVYFNDKNQPHFL